MVARSILALGLSGLIALLAGCASRPPVPVSAEAPRQGYFKVGTPYEVQGVWYTPHVDWSYDETGIASWYGREFHGRTTANGEIFNLNALTAAHPTLPLPSIVEVTNLENGRSLRLRVNDRGPYVRGRIIDVSRRAAQLLGFEIPGTARVRVRLLARETQIAQALARRGIIGDSDTELAAAVPAAPPGAAVPSSAPVTAQPLPMLSSAAPPGGIAGNPPSVAARSRGLVEADAAPPQPLIESPEVPPPDSEAASAAAVTMVPVPASTALYVQVGAFADPDNAFHLKRKLERLGRVRVTNTVVNGTTLYRVRIGPVSTVGAADALLGKVVDHGISAAQIVVD